MHGREDAWCPKSTKNYRHNNYSIRVCAKIISDLYFCTSLCIHATQKMLILLADKVHEQERHIVNNYSKLDRPCMTFQNPAENVHCNVTTCAVGICSHQSMHR